MKIRLDKTFSGFVLFIIFFNAVIHTLGIKNVINPIGMTSVMTFYTSLSLGLLAFSFFKEKSPLIQSKLYVVAFFIQIASLIVLASGYNTEVHYFQCSSLPTSLFLLLATSAFYLERKGKLPVNMVQLIGPTLLLLSSFFVFAFVSETFFFLGISEERIGVGLSLYTLASFIFLSAAAKYRYSNLINLDQFDIQIRPKKLYIAHVLLSGLNFSLLFIDLKLAIFSSIALQTFSLTLCYIFIVKPFQKSPSKYVTICSWTRKIRDDEGNWHSIEDVLMSLGVSVTHGISPEALESMNRSSTIAKAKKEI